MNRRSGTGVSRGSSRAGRWLAGALLALGAAIAPGGVSAAMAAEVEPGDAVYIGAKEGYGGTGVFPIWSSGVQDGDPDYWAYCIEHDVSAETGLLGVAGGLDSYLGANYFTDPAVTGKVLWVLANSFPAVSLEDLGAAAGVPGISRNDAIEATQYAIWRYTDLTFDAPWAWETPDSEAAYWYLVNGANASPGLTPEDLQVTASVTAPGTPQTAGSLVGPFTVNTDQASVVVSVDPAVTITDAAGTAVDPNAVVDGQELYLDLRGSTAAGSATVRATAVGSGSTGTVISVPTTPGGTPTAEDHAQSIILVAPETAQTTGEATVDWAAQPGAVEPVIGTSLVDAADGDRVLGWNGGTVIDTVAYQNLVPGTEYTISGELMRKSDGQPTGITGATTFTPTVANGSIDVSFVVPEGYAGETLVAFEELFEGAGGAGEPVAEHKDIDDAAQTVTVETAPEVPVPAIGTSLVDAADQDHVLTSGGGTLVDTVAYLNLTPGVEYTVVGELMDKADSQPTGIMGSATFTPTSANGSIDVTFTVPAGFSGDVLVAFEWLFVGDDEGDEPVAAHTDIDDAAQTVAVEAGTSVVPTTPKPGSGSLAVTGAAAPTVIIAAASAALLAGAILMRSRRRDVDA
ncbi:VaFE repeat-containing surface-anchored protein [Microbacterium sp. LBN7]|uniref:VaFE repeat-containing surface-anchored protein n=1 Tax=Microbacterium sp. LBN7 TaxID=3129773 RepID=UPI0032477AD8